MSEAPTIRMIRARVRDVSFDEMERQHKMKFNLRYREPWESMRGQIVTIEVPHLGEDERCCIGGRVFLCVDLYCKSMCEHQLEIGD